MFDSRSLSLLYSTLQYSTVQYSTVHYITVQQIIHYTVWNGLVRVLFLLILRCTVSR